MTKRHSTKKSLIASILILCLCFTSFVGTTFAWFTDEVTSTNNVIKSGRLDIDLQYATVKDGQISGWSTVEKADKIFDPNALWEPGRVEVVYLKATNLGTLALKYQLRVNIANEIPGTNVAGDEFYLSDHLVFKVVDMPNALTTYTDREAVATAAGTEKGLKDYSGKTTSLEVGGEDYVALIVYMPESVGNEANYRGDAVPTITLGVNMYATQDTVEKDSFDDQYDDDAWHEKFTVATVDELNTAIENAKDGDVVVFGANMESTEGVIVTDKNIAIDLNGKTFKVSEGANANNRVFKIGGNSNVTIKNGTLVAEGDITSGAYGTVRTEGAANVTLENVKMYSYRGYGLNVKANAGTTVTMNNCEIYAQYSGGVEAAGGTVVLNNTTIKQEGVYSGAAWCSVAIGVNGNGKAIVNSGNYSAKTISTDSNAANGTWVAYVMSSGGTLEINGGTFNGVVAETAAAANACGIICADRAAIVNVNGGNFISNGAIFDMRNNVGSLPNPQAIISGGVFNADPEVSGLYSSNLISIADGFKAVQAGDEYHVISESVSADLYIANAAQLKAFADDVNSGNNYQGKTIVLLGDIDLGGMAWTPIGNGANGFSGTFDGRNYTISNYTVNVETAAGLFGYALNGGNINNLKVKNAVIAANDYAGAILGRGYTDVVNCHAENVKVTVTPYYVSANGVYDGGAKAGAIVGQLLEGAGNTVVDCSAKNVEIVGYRDLGGVLGMAHNNNSVSGCTASDITIEYLSVDGVYDDGATPNQNAGAIVGRIQSSATVSFVNEGDNEKFTLVVRVKNADELKAALGSAKGSVYIILADDIVGDVVVPRKANLNMIIDGCDNEFNGMITIEGDTDTGSLTIKNVNFLAGAGAESVIVANQSYKVNGVNYNNYVKNIIIDNCTFADPEADLDCAAIRAAGGGKKYWTIKNCVVDSSMHSLLQANNIEVGLVIDNCQVYSKNGINLNQTYALTMTNCRFDVTGYAVRFGTTGDTVYNEVFNISDCTLKSACDDGDAVIMYRYTAFDSTLTLENTTLEGSLKFSGNTSDTVIIEK